MNEIIMCGIQISAMMARINGIKAEKRNRVEKERVERADLEIEPAVEFVSMSSSVAESLK